jgi:type IV secretory pathway TrbL component
MNTETDKKELAVASIVAIILLPFLFCLNAYTLAYLWLWFVVPLGVPAIGMAHALGILCLKGFLTSHLATFKHDEEDVTKSKLMWTKTARNIGVPFACLAFGYIYHSFM